MQTSSKTERGERARTKKTGAYSEGRLKPQYIAKGAVPSRRRGWPPFVRIQPWINSLFSERSAGRTSQPAGFPRWLSSKFRKRLREQMLTSSTRSAVLGSDQIRLRRDTRMGSENANRVTDGNWLSQHDNDGYWEINPSDWVVAYFRASNWLIWAFGPCFEIKSNYQKRRNGTAQTVVGFVPLV